MNGLINYKLELFKNVYVISDFYLFLFYLIVLQNASLSAYFLHADTWPSLHKDFLAPKYSKSLEANLLCYLKMLRSFPFTTLFGKQASPTYPIL